MTAKWGRRFDVKEAAEYLGLPVKTIYCLVEQGRIACLRTDGRTLERRLPDGRTERYVKSGRIVFFETDLDAWIEAHRQPASDEPALTLLWRPHPMAVGHDLPLPARRRFS